MTGKPRILVLGGGFAGLESAFYLREKLEDRVDITLVSERDYFLFRPSMIYVPFGQDPEKHKIYLEGPARKRHIDFIEGKAEAIDPDRHVVKLPDFETSFDYLVIATGAAIRPKEIMGLAENAVTLWTPEDMLRLRHAYLALEERARGGARQRLVFLIPPNNRTAGPLYEMALMTDTWLREQGVRDMVDVTFATCEEGYVQAFGPRLNTLVNAEFEERGIAGHRGFVVSSVEPGRVCFQNGEAQPFDLLVSFPPHVAGSPFAGMPMDDRGFVHVDPDSRRVQGRERIFAVGDAADFPIKQAFLALLQADAAADHIAAEIMGRKPEVIFEPMTVYVMEQLNKATFAQVPLRYTGDGRKPVTVDLENMEEYKVGVSPVWSFGKRAVGFYLPWRFGQGQPFHTGVERIASKMMAG